MLQRNYTPIYSILGIIALLSFLLNLRFGSVTIPVEAILDILAGNPIEKKSWSYIILEYRLPKAITTVLVGIGLAISGLMMQTFFRNPLAGPYVLGLSSGASLGVALVILSAGFISPSISYYFNLEFSIAIAASLGSFLVLLAILSFASRVKDSTSLLIVGLMFSSFTSAIVGVLSYFSTAEELQKFTLWSMGNLGGLSWFSIQILTVCCGLGLMIGLLNIKALNSLLLGERYAISLGINLKKTRYSILFSTSILAGSITAFVGPVAFIGLAVPHMTRLIFKTSNHHVLFIGCVLIGSIVLSVCDMISQVPGSDLIFPINAVTSIFGAPVVVWLLTRKKNVL